MMDHAFLLNRVSQLQARYLETYGDELTRDEVARYLGGLVADRQRAELAIFDNLPTNELVATLDALTLREEHAAPSEMPPENIGDLEVILTGEDFSTKQSEELLTNTKKPRGRPKGWRKNK